MRSAKADREHRTDECLHCVLMTALEKWFERHGKREGGKVVIDVVWAIEKLSECTVDVVQMVPDRSNRRRGFRFAHDALDACLKAAHTGKLQAVDIPTEN